VEGDGREVSDTDPPRLACSDRLGNGCVGYRGAPHSHASIQLFCTDLKGNIPRGLLQKVLKTGMESSLKKKMKYANSR
jgi:hypothetical protein